MWHSDLMLNAADDFFTALAPNSFVKQVPLLSRAGEWRSWSSGVWNNWHRLHPEGMVGLELGFRTDPGAPSGLEGTSASCLCHCWAVGPCQGQMRSRLRDPLKTVLHSPMYGYKVNAFWSPKLSRRHNKWPLWRIQVWETSGGMLWGLSLVIWLNAEVACPRRCRSWGWNPNWTINLALTSPPGMNSLAQHLLFSRVSVICWPENQPLETSSLDFLYLIFFLDQTSNISG